MIREAESGVLRAVQKWAAKQIALIPELMAEGVFVMAEDEGDYESELEKRIARGVLSVFVSTPSMARTGYKLREVEVSIKTLESVKIHRSGSRIVNWTALRVTEAIIAKLDHVKMDAQPWAVFEATSEPIQLESQAPWLVYEARLTARVKIENKSV